MKRKLLLAMLLVTTLCGIAQPQPRTSLYIQSQRHEKFFVYVNNQQMNARPVESICLTDMRPQHNFMLQVVLDNRNGTSTSMQVQLHPGDNNYEVEYIPRADRLTLVTTNYAIRTNDFVSGESVFGPVLPPAPQPAPSAPQPGQPGHHPQPGHGGPGHHPQPAPPAPPAPQPAPPAPAPQPAPAVVPPMPMPCSPEELATAKRAIQEQTFENDKFTVAKQVVKSGRMTAEQLAEIAHLFDFERTKLDFLKYAYDYCFNPDQYYVVNSVFDFSSSVRELNKYIEKR